MKASQITDLDTHRIPFRLAESGRLPIIGGCYFLSHLDGEVLYIGQTINLNRRFQEHISDVRMTSQTPLGRALWFEWVILANHTLELMESTYLAKYQASHFALPPLNRAGP